MREKVSKLSYKLQWHKIVHCLQVSNNCGYMLLTCTWLGEKIDCDDYFETSKSDVGFCCSFNTVHLSEQL